MTETGPDHQQTITLCLNSPTDLLPQRSSRERNTGSSIVLPEKDCFFIPHPGFPFILLGILRMKRKKKKEKKAKEGGLVSSWHQLKSLPQVVIAFAKKISRAL